MAQIKQIFIFAILLVLFCACKGNQPDDKKQPTGALPGVFSISSKEKVYFSQGNLQYQASTNTWRFAENQYDIIGNDNQYISSTYEGWIDLFGWGTGDNPTNISKEWSDYSTYVEWGSNPIINGGNVANMWRTLTHAEWTYLFYGRKNAKSLYGSGSVNGIQGTIILPDNWSQPEGISFVDSNGNYYSNNIYNRKQWAVMESAGAVFWPAAGRRQGTVVSDVGTGGLYWSSEFCYYDRAYCLWGTSMVTGQRYSGFSVRLVH